MKLHYTKENILKFQQHDISHNRRHTVVHAKGKCDVLLKCLHLGFALILAFVPTAFPSVMCFHSTFGID